VTTISASTLVLRPAHRLEHALGRGLREVGEIEPRVADAAGGRSDVAHEPLALGALLRRAVEVATDAFGTQHTSPLILTRSSVTCAISAPLGEDLARMSPTVAHSLRSLPGDRDAVVGVAHHDDAERRETVPFRQVGELRVARDGDRSLEIHGDDELLDEGRQLGLSGRVRRTHRGLGRGCRAKGFLEMQVTCHLHQALGARRSSRLAADAS
jgi:hypothetical protein